MSIQQLFVQTNDALGGVVDQIRDDQFALTLPTSLASNTVDVKSAINRLSYDNAWVPAVLEGQTAQEVGDRFEFLNSTDDTRAAFAKYAALASGAARALRDSERTVHLSYGDFPAAEYLRHITLYRLLQGYDIAAMAEVRLLLPDEFVEGLSAEFGPLIEGYRGYGFFPAAVEAGVDADAQTRLFARFGRS